jgi:V-type H+-transporting ATPase subunit H
MSSKQLPPTPDETDIELGSVASTYLDDHHAKIKQRPIPWEGYHRAGLITADELDLIRAYDVHTARGQAYAELFLHLLDKLSRLDTIQYVLLLTHDYIQGTPVLVS